MSFSCAFISVLGSSCLLSTAASDCGHRTLRWRRGADSLSSQRPGDPPPCLGLHTPGLSLNPISCSAQVGCGVQSAAGRAARHQRAWPLRATSPGNDPAKRPGPACFFSHSEAQGTGGNHPPVWQASLHALGHCFFHFCLSFLFQGFLHILIYPYFYGFVLLSFPKLSFCHSLRF